MDEAFEQPKQQDQTPNWSLSDRLTNWMLDVSVNGYGVLEGALQLSERYTASGHSVDELINWTAAQAAAVGFMTNLGGLLTLPVSLPANIAGALALQTRLIATIAIMNGHNPHDQRVRTGILLCIAGSPAVGLLQEAGVQVGKRIALSAIEAIPGSLLISINRAVGTRLLTKAGTTGVINFTRYVPVVGGIVAGSIDGAMTYAVGKAAKQMFASKAKEPGQEIMQ